MKRIESLRGPSRRVCACRQHRFLEEMLQRGHAVGNTVSNLFRPPAPETNALLLEQLTDRFIFVLFVVGYIEAQQITITTSPVLSENVVATGYENLQLISTITGSPLFCSRRMNGQTAIFYESNACLSKDSISDDRYGGVCSKTENVVTFTFSINPLLP